MVWLELPSGFHRPEQPEEILFSGQEIGSDAAAGMPPDEDG